MLQRCIAKLVLIGAGHDETGIVGYLLRLLEEVVKTCFDARPVAAVTQEVRQSENGWNLFADDVHDKYLT